MIFNVSFLCLSHTLSLDLSLLKEHVTNIFWQSVPLIASIPRKKCTVSCWLVVCWSVATPLSCISMSFYSCLCSLLWSSGSLLKHMIIWTWSLHTEAPSCHFFTSLSLVHLVLDLNLVGGCYNMLQCCCCFMLFPRCSWRSTTTTGWSQSCWKPLQSLAPESQSPCSIFVVCWKISSGLLRRGLPIDIEGCWYAIHSYNFVQIFDDIWYMLRSI